MDYKSIVEDFKNDKITIYDLVLLFDKGIDIKNKEEGVIYTPKYITDYIINIINPDINEVILEPSVGHGVFLFSLIEFIEKKYNLTGKEIKVWFEKNIIANDINKKTIEELKLILTVFFEKKGVMDVNFDNIFAADSLFHQYEKFDLVIGNPPYIRTKNIEEGYLRKIRENFESCQSGNIDIYYAFMEKFSKISKRFSFIVPNSYITNKSAKRLRGIIEDSLVSIVDFKEKLIFENARTYTSIFLIDNLNKKNHLEYSNDINSSPILVNKEDINKEKWIFNNNIKKSIVSVEEMGELSFTSGIATLRDGVFIIKNPEEKNEYYIKIHEGIEYLIEKDVCIDFYKITKPNERSVIIYPYSDGKIIPELEFSKKFPMAYQYLLEVKALLEKRDKGKTAKYDSWFAYGRRQGLNIVYNSYYLLVPIMTNGLLNIDIKNINEKFLIGSGFCIESSNVDLLNKIKEELNSENFLNYLRAEGKAWPGKKTYYTLTSSQLREFINCE